MDYLREAECDSDGQEGFTYPPLPQHQFQLVPPIQLKCQQLIITTSNVQALFAHSFIAQNTPSARLNFSRAKQQSLADFFQSSQGQLFLIFNHDFEPMKEVNFGAWLKKFVSWSSVIVITSRPYCTLERTGTPQIKSLRNSFWKEPSFCGNFLDSLDGVAAQMLIEAQLAGLPGICYVGITEDYEASSASIECLFGALRGKGLPERQCDISERVRRFNQRKHNSKLYL